MTFIDHCQVPLGTGEHIIIFVFLDGATTLLTAEADNCKKPRTSLSSGTTLSSTTCSQISCRRSSLHDGDMGTLLPVPRHYTDILGTKHTMAKIELKQQFDYSRLS